MEIINALHEIIKGSLEGGFWHFIGYCIMTAALFGTPLRIASHLIKTGTNKLNGKKDGTNK